MKLDFIPLSKLSISKANMRHGRKAPDVSDILPTIRKRGILQPLIVRPNCGPDAFEIVAGRRRFHAAQLVANENGEAEPVPCAILDAGDDADAIEASMIENLARLDPDEVTQWENFVRLVKEGRSVDDIAATFGLPELTVKRVLALGNLLPAVRDLYRAEKIDAATVRHLTLASKSQQKSWLALHDDPEKLCPDRPPVEGMVVRRAVDFDQSRAVRRHQLHRPDHRQSVRARQLFRRCRCVLDRAEPSDRAAAKPSILMPDGPMS